MKRKSLFKSSITVLSAAAMVIALVGCGNGASTANTQTASKTESGSIALESEANVEAEEINQEEDVEDPRVTWALENEENLEFNFFVFNNETQEKTILENGNRCFLNENEILMFHAKEEYSEFGISGAILQKLEFVGKSTVIVPLLDFSGEEELYFVCGDKEVSIVILSDKPLWTGTEQDGIIEIVSEHYEIAEREWHNSTTNTANDAIRYYAELYNISNYLIKISDCYLDIYDENMSEIKHTAKIDFVVSKYMNPGENAYISLGDEFIWSEINAYLIASATGQSYEYAVNTYDPEKKLFCTAGRNGELENIVLGESDKYVLRYKVIEVDEKEYIDIQIKDADVEVKIQEDATDFGWIKKVIGTLENNSDYDLNNIYYAVIVKQEEKIIGIYSNGCFLGTYYLPIESLNSKEECNFELDEIAYNIMGGWIIDNTKEISYELKVLDYDMVPKN